MLLARLAGAAGRSALVRRIAGAAFWTTLGTLAQRGGLLVVTFLVGRLGGVVLLGQFAFALVTATAAATLAASAFGIMATRWVAADLRAAPDRVGGTVRSLFMVTIAVIGVPASICVLAPTWVATGLLHSAEMAEPLRLVAPMMLLAALVILNNSVLFGFEAFRAVARANAIGGAAGTAGAIGGMWLSGLEGALLGWSAGVAIQLTIGLLALRQEMTRHGIRMGSRGRDFRTLLSFGTPLFLGALLVEPVNWIAGTFLLALPGGYAEMGVYQAANQWFLAVMFLPSMLAQANLPVMVELLADGKRKAFVRVTVGTMLVSGLIGCVAVLGSLWFGPLLIAQYGPAFVGRETVLILAIATAACLGLQLPAGNVLVAFGRNWAGLLLNLTWAATLLIGAGYWVADGADGLSLARLVAYALHIVWTLGVLAMLVRSLAGRRVAAPNQPPDLRSAAAGRRTRSS